MYDDHDKWNDWVMNVHREMRDLLLEYTDNYVQRVKKDIKYHPSGLRVIQGGRKYGRGHRKIDAPRLRRVK